MQLFRQKKVLLWRIGTFIIKNVSMIMCTNPDWTNIPYCPPAANLEILRSCRQTKFQCKTIWPAINHVLGRKPIHTPLIYRAFYSFLAPWQQKKPKLDTHNSFMIWEGQCFISKCKQLTEEWMEWRYVTKKGFANVLWLTT